MRQIWNRIFRLAKTYLNETSDTFTAERILRSDDDELKKIIDELDKPKNNSKPESEGQNSQKSQNSQSKEHTQEQQNQQHSQHQHSQHQQQSQQQHSRQQRPRPSSGAMTLVKAASVLGVRTDASVPEIKSAYKKKVMKFHPDRVANAPLDEQTQSKQIIVEVNQAYQFFQQLKGF